MSEYIYPRVPGLFTRIALVVVIGFAGIHIAGYFLYGHERMVANALTFATTQAQRTFELDTLLQTNPELLAYFDSDSFSVRHVSGVVDLPQDRWPHSDEVRQAVQRSLSEAGFAGEIQRVEMAFLGGPRPRFEMLLPATGGGYLHAVAKTPIGRGGYGSPAGFWTTLIFLFSLGGVLFVTRRTTRQLGRFASAATALGEGRAVQALPEKIGSAELRRASAAFNNMQTKVAQLLAERSDMLAGVSHDLRTLVTRLGLRAEGIGDPEQRSRAADDIQLMSNILDQALTFSKDEHSDEVYVSVDVESLVCATVEDYESELVEVDVTGGRGLIVQAQYTAFKRLLVNLIGNAIKYGGHAKVILEAGELQICDPGSGFDQASETAALRPYGRLQAARSQEDPGTGLGLAIVDNICRRHGWSLGFEQSDAGFCVKVGFS